MRSFLAIDLPEDVVDSLTRLQAMLPAGRVVPPENLHLTLAFLGDQAEEQLEALHDELRAVSVAAFDLRFSGLGCFGAPRPATLFAEIAGCAALGALHAKLHSLIRRSGMSLPRDRFRPHVTLARFRKGGDPAVVHRFLELHGNTQLPGFTACGMSLWQSRLYRDGAQYDRLADYAFHPG